MRKALILPIRFYQFFLSPFFGQHCRYTPTCSDYAIEAIENYGIFKGFYLAGKRLFSCHPWSAGGHNPVPINSCSEKISFSKKNHG